MIEWEIKKSGEVINGEIEIVFFFMWVLVKRWNICNVFVLSYKNIENMFFNFFKKFCDDFFFVWI